MLSKNIRCSKNALFFSEESFMQISGKQEVRNLLFNKLKHNQFYLYENREPIQFSLDPKMDFLCCFHDLNYRAGLHNIPVDQSICLFTFYGRYIRIFLSKIGGSRRHSVFAPNSVAIGLHNRKEHRTKAKNVCGLRLSKVRLLGKNHCMYSRNISVFMKIAWEQELYGCFQSRHWQFPYTLLYGDVLSSCNSWEDTDSEYKIISNFSFNKFRDKYSYCYPSNVLVKNGSWIVYPLKFANHFSCRSKDPAMNLYLGCMIGTSNVTKQFIREFVREARGLEQSMLQGMGSVVYNGICLVDISPGGLSFSLDLEQYQRFCPNGRFSTMVEMEMEHVSWDSSVSLKGRGRYAEVWEENGLVRMGVEFQMLTEDDRRAILKISSLL